MPPGTRPHPSGQPRSVPPDTDKPWRRQQARRLRGGREASDCTLRKHQRPGGRPRGRARKSRPSRFPPRKAARRRGRAGRVGRRSIPRRPPAASRSVRDGGALFAAARPSRSTTAASRSSTRPALPRCAAARRPCDARLGDAQIANLDAPPRFAVRRGRGPSGRALLGDAGFDAAADLFVHAAVEADRGHRADDHRQRDGPLEGPPATMDGPRENGNYPSLEWRFCFLAGCVPTRTTRLSRVPVSRTLPLSRGCVSRPSA